MIKLTFCLKRKPGMSLAEFQDYWLNQHGPLVRSLADVLKIRRYIQMHSTDDPLNAAMAAARGTPEGYDGVAELWFDSLDTFRDNARSPEARAANQTLAEDEAKFIDLANSPVWVGEEHVIIAD